jgi:hypothetical protein
MGAREDLAVIVRADTSALASDLSRAAGLAKKFALDVEKSAPKADFGDSSAAAFGKAGRAANWAKNQFAGASSSLASFTARAAVASGAFLAVEAGFQGIGSAIEFVRDSVRKAADFEQMQIGFEVMLGSAELAMETMGKLRKFAADTPFSSSEVSAGARQLLAYGVAADQLIPTLKLLGTISAGTNTPLSANVYRYGTTKVQGVAHQIDLNQMTNAGVDIYPGIAKALKIDQTQIHKFTEENRVDFNVFQSSLIDLSNTKFAGLLERQAKSLKGAFEQLADAWDVAKLKLGQTIVRESGMREWVKDGESLAKSVERAFDSPAFARGVHFIADGAKAAGHLAYEFGRAGVNVAGIGLEGIGRAFPGIERAANSFHELLKDAQNFKIDDEKLANSALNFTEGFIIGFAKIADGADKFGKSIQKDLLDPLGDVVKRLAQINAFGKAPLAAWNATILKQLGLFDTGAPPAAPEAPAAQVEMPKLAATDKDVLQQWAKLKQEHTDSFKAWQTPAGGPFGAMRDFANREQYRGSEAKLVHFLGLFEGDAFSNNPAELLNKGVVPKRLAIQAGAAAVAGAPGGPKSYEDIAREGFGAFKTELLTGVAKNKSQQASDNLGDFRTLGLNAMAAHAALGPYAPLAPAIDQAREGVLRPDKIVPSHIVELADKLNERFTGSDLPARLADLDKARDLNRISPDVYTKGRNSAIQEVAARLGIGGEAHLAGAAMVGSAEDARILAQFRAGSQGQTTEDLLRQILDVLRNEAMRGAANIGREISDLMPQPIQIWG